MEQWEEKEKQKEEDESELVDETQALRIIRKFGRPRDLMRALERVGKGRVATSVYRWIYPHERGGTGGLIPTSALDDVMKAARHEGIIITAEDIDPRITPFNFKK